jgi:CBS domain-containing protein
LKEAIKYMHDCKQNCLLVVDDEDLLEGILTYGDIRRLSKTSSDASTGDSTIIDV